MFREMRRFKQQLTEEQAIQVLINGKTGILGVIGDEGYPYSVPVNYVYADGKIYFHCAKEGHKQDAIEQCNKVSFCVIERDDVLPEKLTTGFRSVILFGKARKLETKEEIFHAAEVFALKYNPDKMKIDKVITDAMGAFSCVEIVIEHMTGKEGMELAKERCN